MTQSMPSMTKLGFFILGVLSITHLSTASLFDEVLGKTKSSPDPKPVIKTVKVKSEIKSLFDSFVSTSHTVPHRLAPSKKDKTQTSLFDGIIPSSVEKNPLKNLNRSQKPLTPKVDLSSINLDNPISSQNKPRINKNGIRKTSKDFSDQEKEVLRNLKLPLTPTKRKIAPFKKTEDTTEDILSKVSESILNLGRAFQDHYLESIEEAPRPPPNTKHAYKEPSFTAKEIKSLLNLVKTGRNTIEDIYYHIALLNSSPPSLDMVNQLYKLGLALEVLKNQNHDDNESDLDLAKHLFRENINSVNELTRNQREVMNSFKREIMTLSKQKMSPIEANEIARFFTVSNKEDQRWYNSYLRITTPSPYTYPPLTARPRPPLPPPVPTARPPSPPVSTPSPPIGPPAPPVGPPAPPVGPPSPPVRPPAPPISASSPPINDNVLFSPPQAEQDIIFLVPEEPQDNQIQNSPVSQDPRPQQAPKSNYLPPRAVLPLENERAPVEPPTSRWVPIRSSDPLEYDEEPSSISDPSSLSQEDPEFRGNSNFHYHYHLYSKDLRKAFGDQKFSDEAVRDTPDAKDDNSYQNSGRTLKIPQRDRSSSVESKRRIGKGVSRSPPLIILDSTYTSLAANPIRTQSNPQTNSYPPVQSRSPQLAPTAPLQTYQQLAPLANPSGNYAFPPAPPVANPASSYSTPLQTPALSNPSNTYGASLQSPQANPQQTLGPPLQLPPANPQSYAAPLQAPLANPSTSYRSSQQFAPANPSSMYGTPQRDPLPANPPTSYGPPQRDPLPANPPASYGPPQRDLPPANPPTSYGPPQRDPPRRPIRQSNPQSVVFLKPVKQKKKKLFKKKKNNAPLYEAFAVNFNNGQDYPNFRDDFYDQFDDRREQLRDEYWRSREELELQHYRMAGLDRLRDEIEIQKKRKHDVSKKLLKSIAKDTFGKGMKSMFYRGATALSSMALYPFRAMAGRRRRDTRTVRLQNNLNSADLENRNAHVNTSSKACFLKQFCESILNAKSTDLENTITLYARLYSQNLKDNIVSDMISIARNSRMLSTEKKKEVCKAYRCVDTII